MLSGRYNLEDRFAAGAQGTIWSATDRATGGRVLIKCGSGVREEALLARRLQFPLIAAPLDCGMDPSLGAYAVYPKVGDPHLLQWAAQDEKRAASGRAHVALKIAEFLCFLHNRGWLYNDFKPQHFLIGNQLQVIDLGLCSRINSEEVSTVFSGTFPYISPERLAGRPSDARSDIFGFGMTLLHSFFPNEPWPESPSLPALHEVQSQCKKLKGFWGELISEMTAFDLHQRPASAHEVWNRLLPGQARGSFLFFPFPAHFSVPGGFPENEQALFAESQSRILLRQAEDQAVERAWKLGFRTFAPYDLGLCSASDAFRSLAACVTGRQSDEFVSAVGALEAAPDQEPALLVFRVPETTGAPEQSLLYLGVSALARTSWAHVLLCRSHGRDSDLQQGAVQFRIPHPGRMQMEQALEHVLPFDETRRNRILSGSPALPEQVLGELKRQLPRQAKEFWPATAHMVESENPLDELDVAEKKLVYACAIGGGDIPREHALAALDQKDSRGGGLAARLPLEGVLQASNGRVILLLPVDHVLAPLRKFEIRRMAIRLLKKWKTGDDLRSVYHAATHARQSKTAAWAALRMLRRVRKASGPEAITWTWRAFAAGAKLQRPALYRMARYFLIRMDLQKTEAIAKHLQRGYGRSYRLCNLVLECSLRRHDYTRAELEGRRAIAVARARGHTRARGFFSARLAGILIQQQKLDEGEKLLNQIPLNAEERPNPISGLIHHFLGLSYYYRGRLDDSRAELEEAVRIHHPLASTSLMNLGATLLGLDRLEEAENCIKRAIQQFQERHDVDRLCYGYNNLGVLHKLGGRMERARECYLRAFHLARAHKNGYMIATALMNAAGSYELEGRPAQAIRFYSRGAAVAAKLNSRMLNSFALTNAALQHAIQGNFQKALALLHKALNIRRKLGMQVRLAFTTEALGLTYLHAGRWKQALEQLGKAATLFENCACASDARRSRLYSVLALLNTHQRDDAERTLESVARNFDKPGSFEHGLYHFACASAQLARPSIDQAVCRQSIHEAERVFQKAPSLLWLAKTYKLKAEYLRKTDHIEKSLVALKRAFDIFSRLGARKELVYFTREVTQMTVSDQLIREMTEKLPFKMLLMIKELLSLDDPESMISGLLTAAVNFTDMDRAVLILQETPVRIFKSTTIEQSAIDDICEISMSAIQTSTESDKPFVCLDACENPALQGRKSILANHIMSIVCLPLRVKGKLLGMLYLDSKEGVESLSSTERVLVEILASVAALALDNAIALERFRAENEKLRGAIEGKNCPEVIGTSKELTRILQEVRSLADRQMPVLITGETGTGKELIARVLHYAVPREGPFVALNCSAFPGDLLESELFGHEKGAFTSASTPKKGLFEHAQDGTVFLDEVGEMPLAMQAKVLRVLQGGEYRKVGGLKTLHTNARVVLATNRNLEDMVKEGTFREDLYYRINAVRLHLPPLHERPEDIALLASGFLKNALMAAAKTNVIGFTPEATALMIHYAWPGNARQLKNEIERIVALADKPWITADDFDPAIRQSITIGPAAPLSTRSLRQIEKDTILERLKEADGNVQLAAKSLGLSRHGLYSKMKRYQILK